MGEKNISTEQIDMYIPFMNSEDRRLQKTIIRTALAESLSKDNSNAWGNRIFPQEQVDMYIPFMSSENSSRVIKNPIGNKKARMTLARV